MQHLIDRLNAADRALREAQAELTSIRVLGPWERDHHRWLRRNLRAPGKLGLHVDHCDERMALAYDLPQTGWWTWHFCPSAQPRRFDTPEEAMAWLDEQATAEGVILQGAAPAAPHAPG